jgi:HK97 family phage major capsid protein
VGQPTKTNEVKKMTPEEKKALLAEYQEELKVQAAEKAEREAELKAAVEAAVMSALKTAPAIKQGAYLDGHAPAFLQYPTHGAFKAYDAEAFRPYVGSDEIKGFFNYLHNGEGGMKASNAVAMQEGTPGEGGYAVPTPLYNAIIAKKSEVSLRTRLGLRKIPGKGLTVNVPTDAEDDGEFVATNEEATTDLDSPALGTLAMTLVKYTKRIVASWELLEDEDVELLSFIANWVGRGAAKTENTLILAAVAAGGTAFTPFAAGAAIGFGELENAVWNSTIPYYLDDGGSNAWVMRPTAYGSIAKITSVDRAYADSPQGSTGGTAFRPNLLGYPVYFSEKAAAVGTSAKPIYFGNWNYVGYREAPGMTVIRDPYSMANTGQVVYHYYFRQVYKVLQAGAIGYQANPSA